MSEETLVFLLFVLSLFHQCADGSWSAWLLLCFPIRQANGLITSSAALEMGKPNMKGGMLLVLHVPGQNHIVYRDPHDAGFGLQHLVCWPKAVGLPAMFCICNLDTLPTACLRRCAEGFRHGNIYFGTGPSPTANHCRG